MHDVTTFLVPQSIEKNMSNVLSPSTHHHSNHRLVRPKSSSPHVKTPYFPFYIHKPIQNSKRAPFPVIRNLTIYFVFHNGYGAYMHAHLPVRPVSLRRPAALSFQERQELRLDEPYVVIIPSPKKKKPPK